MSDWLKNFESRRREWSHRTYGAPPRWINGEPSKNGRGPEGPLKHLQREVAEVLAAPRDLEEYADLGFLLFDALDRAGFTVEDWCYAMEFKLAKNRARKWGTPDAEGVVEHVR